MSYGRLAGLPHVNPKTPPVLTLTGPATRDQVAGLSDEVRALLEGGGGGVVVVDVSGMGPPCLVAVDALARLQLAARRAGGRIRLRDPDPALRALLALVALPVEVEGDAEEGEPALGVEEEVETGEAAV
ncbi:STAS domain-containing protein [Streptomyces sp. NPDC018693]|uniref:STAS domain-containing protein n=1 Tax=unclassified Streptomyces TaxID=2593676 RepID=UPI00378C67EA